MDPSNGYEGVSVEFLARRGRGRSTGAGVNAVRKWARTLPPGATAIDLGCGPGFHITEVLVVEGLNVFGIDAAPSFVQAFRRNLPTHPWLANPFRSRDFLIELSMLSWRGGSCSCFLLKINSA
jgi:2-polyprenyl-3-methyl-5-hydroxy-6-metoxy-1,4-benzoquinol methylase